MRRLYFLLPDLAVTRNVVDELLLARIEEKHIHVIAKEGTELGELPEATLVQKSDFVPAMERGVALGGATGLVAGLVAVAMPGVVIAGGALLAMGLAGAGMGAWVSGMIGTDVPNTRLDSYREAVESGEILMMVDVPKARVDEITAAIAKHHPEAHLRGTEPAISVFTRCRNSSFTIGQPRSS